MTRFGKIFVTDLTNFVIVIVMPFSQPPGPLFDACSFDHYSNRTEIEMKMNIRKEFLEDAGSYEELYMVIVYACSESHTQIIKPPPENLYQLRAAGYY